MKSVRIVSLASAFASLGALSTPALAAGAMDRPKAGETKMSQASAAEMTDAEVRRVDKDQGRVTLKHGEIKNLDMPAMTMVFSVKDKAMLAGVKPGDKVRFRVANEGGKLTVTDIAPAK